MALGEADGRSPPVEPSQNTACARPLAEYPRARVYLPPESAATGRHAKAKIRSAEGRRVPPDDPAPTLQPGTAYCTEQAARRYQGIASAGGWPILAKPAGTISAPGELEELRQRLLRGGDLEEDATGVGQDDALIGALKRFQFRAGIEQSGVLDETTRNALNVPAGMRARELEASANRIGSIKSPSAARYVVVNIPAASVEGVENSRAVQRHAAIAGKPSHPSPQLSATIQSITINPSWTVPSSIVENELIPKLRRDPGYLRRAGLVIIGPRGREASIRHLRPSSARTFTIRQRPGAKNALGRLRIDMPNSKEVYLHDTPAKRLFAENYRFLSHGCVRVDGIDDLAVWLLAGTPGHWDRRAIAAVVRTGRTKRIKLARPVPVAWVYLDAWESTDGTVHFAPDVYHLDSAAAGAALGP